MRIADHRFGATGVPSLKHWLRLCDSTAYGEGNVSRVEGSFGKIERRFGFLDEIGQAFSFAGNKQKEASWMLECPQRNLIHSLLLAFKAFQNLVG